MIKIFPCDVSWIDTLTDIAIESYGQNYTYLWSDGGEAYMARVYDKAALLADLTKPDVNYFFVYADDELIGYIRLKQKSHPDRPRQRGLEISKLYLLKQSIGKGAGKIIMAFIIDWAKQHHCAVMWLMVMDSSPAKVFYERYGFRETAAFRLDYPNLIDEYRTILTMIAEI